MSRVKNSVDHYAVARVLRSHMRGLDMALCTTPDLDKLVSNFEGVFCDIIKITPRPTQKLFNDAALEAFRCDAGEALMFGQRMNAAMSFCRIKLKGSTTGERLAPSTRVVCKAMLSAEGVSPDKALQTPKGKSEKRFLSPLKKGASAFAELGASDDSLAQGLPSTSADDIRAMYGLGNTKPRLREPSSPWLQEIVSSQEVDNDFVREPASSSSSKPTSSNNAVLQFEDASKACLVRMVNGSAVEAVMKPGLDGFALGFFGTECFQAEIPNLLLGRTATAPKSAVRKKPAARKPTAKADSEPKTVAKHKGDDHGSDEDSDVPSTKEYSSPQESVEELEGRTPEQVREGYGIGFVKPKSQMHNGGRLAITIVASKGYIVWDGKSWVNLTKTQALAAGKEHGPVLVKVFEAILAKNLRSKEEAVSERAAILEA